MSHRTDGKFADQIPDPEVVPKAQRRQYSAEYKRRILQEYEACTEPGQRGALLRREGLYSSNLTTWRRQRERGELEGLAPKKRGPKADPQVAEIVRQWHEQDLSNGYGSVYLPYALDRKYPNASQEWVWQTVRTAARQAGIEKRVSCHTFRHSFATRLLENGNDPSRARDRHPHRAGWAQRAVPLHRHKDVRTTMIYTHVLQRGHKAVRSPLDGI